MMNMTYSYFSSEWPDEAVSTSRLVGFSRFLDTRSAS